MNTKPSNDDREKLEPSMKGISIRLTGLTAKLGGKEAFAEKVGFSYSQLRRYLMEDSDMKLSTAIKISHLTGTSLEWVATGSGDPHISPNDISNDVIKSEYALIPGYNIQASAGNGNLVPEGELPTRRLAFRHRWLEHRGLHEKDLVLIFADGDSMEPTISDNNTLMVDTSAKQPKDGGIYVIRHGDHLVVKRTQLVFGEGIRLISDNKAYPEQLINFDKATDLEVVGKVVWIGKDV